MFLRKALIEDSEDVATLLMLATGEVIYKFIGKKDYPIAKDFLLHFVKCENNQYSYQNCFVAVDESGIVGAVLVYDGAKLEELRKPVLEYIHTHYDAELIVEVETQAGEIYIDSLAVSPHQQGKGIGSQLIQFIMNELDLPNGYSLGLLVDKTNLRARKLYSGLGFKQVGDKELMGLSLLHFQKNIK